MNWHHTEGWWRDLPAPGPQGATPYSLPPVRPKAAACFLPAQATEVAKGREGPVATGLPGTRPPDAHPPAGSVTFDWVRVSAYWDDRFYDGRAAAPGQKGHFAYLEPYRNVVSVFLLDRLASDPLQRFCGDVTTR